MTEAPRVHGKEYSPLTIRKYTVLGNPIFVAIITDDDLGNLDEIVLQFLEQFRGGNLRLQDYRYITGKLTEMLRQMFPRAEGIAVVAFPDKSAVSSLWGDFMNHLHCRMELYALINTMWML